MTITIKNRRVREERRIEEEAREEEERLQNRYGPTQNGQKYGKFFIIIIFRDAKRTF